MGVRIRALRLARGLTQHQLAGGDFTLDVPVADLLGEPSGRDRQHELMLLEAEREFARGSPADALRLAEGLRLSAAYRGRALRLHGRALLALDRAREALAPLDDAIIEFRGRGQLDLAARTLYDIALAHARLDETEEALLSALQCERALRAGEVVDRTLELQVRALLASAYVRRGDFAAADLQAERALALAQDVTSHDAQAAVYASLAKSEQDRGNLERAAEYWLRSLSELEHLGREQAVAECWNSLALVYLARGDQNKARQALARAETMAQALGHGRLLPWLQVTRAKAEFCARRFAAARELAEAIASHEDAPARARAEAYLILARTFKEVGATPTTVRTAYERAIAVAEGQPPGVRARILRQFADALDALGDTSAGLQLMREAFEMIRPGDV